MTRLSTPCIHVEGPTTLVAYEVSLAPGDPRTWYHVAIRSGSYGPDMVLFAGTGDDLHELLLGLHNVLVDAGQSPDGRSERVVLRPTEAVDQGDELGEASVD